jgi:hypothetical protein
LRDGASVDALKDLIRLAILRKKKQHAGTWYISRLSKTKTTVKICSIN